LASEVPTEVRYCLWRFMEMQWRLWITKDSLEAIKAEIPSLIHKDVKWTSTPMMVTRSTMVHETLGLVTVDIKIDNMGEV
jgi:hypothetical protein